MLRCTDGKAVLLVVWLTAFEAYSVARGGCVPPSPKSAKPAQRTGTEPLIPAKLGKRSQSAKAGLDLVEIPAGWFIMGSPKGVGEANEHPQHNIFLGTFRMARTEVTVAQFRRYCKATRYSYDWDLAERKPTWGYIDAYPMVNVTWDEALGYCRWAGGDLPTEAEWEKAARGTDGRLFPWGDVWNGNNCVHNARHPEPVGSKPLDSSPYGVLDMAGNVMEWCKDYYDITYYSRSPKRNPQGGSKGDKAVMRGGCWLYNYPAGIRCATRMTNYPSSKTNLTRGFRVVFR